MCAAAAVGGGVSIARSASSTLVGQVTAAVRYGRVPVLCWCARSSARRRRRRVSSNVGVLPPRAPAKVVSSQHASPFAIDTYTSDYFAIREPHRHPLTTQKLLFLGENQVRPGAPRCEKCDLQGKSFLPKPKAHSESYSRPNLKSSSIYFVFQLNDVARVGAKLKLDKK